METEMAIAVVEVAVVASEIAVVAAAVSVVVVAASVVVAVKVVKMNADRSPNDAVHLCEVAERRQLRLSCTRVYS